LEIKKIELVTRNKLDPKLAHLYRFQEDNVGQSIWDKVMCYWGTHWELDGNASGTTKIQKFEHP
jgi:hypothetical protein